MFGAGHFADAREKLAGLVRSGALHKQALALIGKLSGKGPQEMGLEVEEEVPLPQDLEGLGQLDPRGDIVRIGQYNQSVLTQVLRRAVKQILFSLGVSSQLSLGYNLLKAKGKGSSQGSSQGSNNSSEMDAPGLPDLQIPQSVGELWSSLPLVPPPANPVDGGDVHAAPVKPFTEGWADALLKDLDRCAGCLRLPPCSSSEKSCTLLTCCEFRAADSWIKLCLWRIH
jgi:hypothetical protein